MASGKESDCDGVVWVLCARFADGQLGAGESGEGFDLGSGILIVSIGGDEELRALET